jgi:hypothetical protein
MRGLIKNRDIIRTSFQNPHADPTLCALWGCIPELASDCQETTNASSTHFGLLIAVKRIEMLNQNDQDCSSGMTNRKALPKDSRSGRRKLARNETTKV